MKVTAETKTAIINALTEKGWNYTDLANKIGRTRSWVSKLLAEKHQIAELNGEMIDAISDKLGVSLMPIVTIDGPISPTALRLSELAESNPAIAELLHKILEVAQPPQLAYIPAVETKKLPKIGAKLTQIVHKLEEGNDPHYSRIAVEALDYLRRFFLKEGNSTK